VTSCALRASGQQSCPDHPKYTMPVQTHNDPPTNRTLASKLTPWLGRGLVVGVLIWVCLSIEDFSKDVHSHTIKISYPLLLNYERITAPQPGFDPHAAEWQPVKTSFPVNDGAIFFVKANDATYAVKLTRQTIKPEQGAYAYLKVGSTDPIAQGLAHTESGSIDLPKNLQLTWSGRSDGSGYVYLDDSFIWNDPPHFTIGVPLQSGDLEQFRHTLPATIHFESVPWKVIEPDVANATTSP
jgi:hypothetical protein